MKIFVEGERYSLVDLEKIFGNRQFYAQHGFDGIITSVGYYHSFTRNELVFMLPKVFMRDDGKTVFGNTAEELVSWFSDKDSVKHSDEMAWIRNISVFFYKSLTEFRKRYPESLLINYSSCYDVKNLTETKSYSYLDILLSFVAFYKKHRNHIHFRHLEAVNAAPKKSRWEKTVRKKLPVISADGNFFYPQVVNKKKEVNSEEELIVYFLSILNRFSEDHQLNINIDRIYPLIKGAKFDTIVKNGSGLNKLKKIKYRYYSDIMKSMHRLCEIYFSVYDKAAGKQQEDFISVSSYNIVFEDMIDRLFSEEIKDIEVEGVKLKELKYNDDGKIIDHIFDHRSLLDGSDIFYIGDSKYYKSTSEAGKVSVFKQFTYAKNVIQYNINLLKDNRKYRDEIRYRDPVTEGYSITPNFFIYGFIENENDYSDHLFPRGEIKSSSHFRYRLFDRDTLFVHQYQINFLFVLKAYTSFSGRAFAEYRSGIKNMFRDNFIDYFNNNSGYRFYQLNEDYVAENIVTENFRAWLGKSFITEDGRLILAVHENDREFSVESKYFRRIKL